MTRLLQLLAKAFYQRGHYLFYRDPGARTGEADGAITVFETFEDIPAPFRPVALPSRLLNVMYHRLRRGEAKLLCYSEDGRELQAFGWIQSWRPFRRRFGVLADEATLLGPYWTSPGHRGRGHYGKLLRHSLNLCQEGRMTRPLLIFTTADNVPSQRGINRAGFEPIGEWVITLWFRLLAFARPVRPADRPRPA